MSQPSLSGLGDRDDRDREREDPTPPISPFIVSEGTSGKGKTTFAQKATQSFGSRKYQDSSLEADDTESELVAIPESDLSESTLHNSVPGSFDNGANFDEMAQPTKSEQAKQVALPTLNVAEPKEKEEKEKEKEKETKKPSRLFMKLNSLDKHTKQSSSDSSKIVTKCSVQEGVRMMVTPSIFMTPQPPIDIAPPNQSVNVQKAIVVTQDNKTDKEIVEPKETKETKDVSEVDGSSKSAIGSLLTEASTSVAKQIIMSPTTSTTKPTSKHYYFFLSLSFH